MYTQRIALVTAVVGALSSSLLGQRQPDPATAAPPPAAAARADAAPPAPAPAPVRPAQAAAPARGSAAAQARLGGLVGALDSLARQDGAVTALLGGDVERGLTSALAEAGPLAAAAADPAALGPHRGAPRGQVVRIGELTAPRWSGAGLAAADPELRAAPEEAPAEPSDGRPLAAFLRAHLGAVEACWLEAGLARTSAGDVRVRFTLAASGELDGLSASVDGLASPALTRCVAGAARGWRAPAGPEAPIAVDWPVRFAVRD